jgi:hypothetical protein
VVSLAMRGHVRVMRGQEPVYPCVGMLRLVYSCKGMLGSVYPIQGMLGLVYPCEGC